MTSARMVGEISRAILADQDGVIAVLRLYLDESGIHDGSPVVTVGGFLADRHKWEVWTKKWNAAKRPLKVFHSADCQNLRGDFRGWSAEDRDALVIRLLKTIAEAGFPGIVIGIVMADFEEVMQGRDDLRRAFGSPYGACFQWALHTVLDYSLWVPKAERIAIIHERNDFRKEAMNAFDFVKERADIMGCLTTLTFGDKASYPPLQAADVLAYEANKFLRDRSKPERRSFSAIKNHLKIGFFDKTNMMELPPVLEQVRDRIILQRAASESAISRGRLS